MSSLKESILKLRAEGKSYRQIEKELGCSKATIAYYCSPGQKEKLKARTKKYRKDNPLLKKVEMFKYRKHRKKKLADSVRYFNKRGAERTPTNTNGYDKALEETFSYKDVLRKFGQHTVCYLSGEPVDLLKEGFELDHITPHSRGGSNSIENMGICHPIVNKMKHDLTPEELVEWCLKVVRHSGYKISK